MKLNIEDLKEIVKNCTYEEKGIACMNDTYYRNIMRTISHLQFKIDKANEYLEDRFIFNEETGECYQSHTFDKANAKELHDILKGE